MDTIRNSPLARAGLVGLAYFAGAELGHALSLKTPGPEFVTLWPPVGLLLAALVLTRWRLWPALLGAACAAHLASGVLLHGRSVPVSLGFWVATAGEACIGAWLLRRFVGLPFTLARVKDVLALGCLSILMSMLVGATLGAGVVKLSGDGAYWSAWQMWWMADALGVVVLAPVVFTLAVEPAAFPGAIRPSRKMERAALFLGLSLVAGGIYGELLPPSLTVPVFVLPFLLWAALRLGPPTTASALLLVAVIGLGNMAQGRGPLMARMVEASERLVSAQGILFVASLSFLALAAIVAERQRAEQQRIKLIAELELALAEIKTLRGLIPLCAWCKKMRDDQGFWRLLEDYLRTYTEAEFTHGMCPDCLEKQVAALEDRDPNREAT